MKVPTFLLTNFLIFLFEKLFSFAYIEFFNLFVKKKASLNDILNYAKDLGLNVKKENVIDISYKNEFNGVFACASLLHLKEDQLIIALSKLKDSLKDEGIIYMSFKEGNFSGIRDGRYYLDMNEENMKKMLDIVGLKLIKCWRNTDKLNRGNVWISFIVGDNSANI